jgi:sugar-specific transcriptional regulator TrmB
MDEEVLEEIGLSKNEAKVYLSLSYLGSTTAGKIANHSKVPRPNVYDAIERLKQKGLVGQITKDGKMFFQASEPQNLIGILKDKEARLNQILPKLVLNQHLSKSKSNVSMSEGLKAARSVFLHFLEVGKDIYVYGAPKIAVDLIGPYLENFHRQRIERGIWMRHIYNSDARDRVAFINKNFKLTEARCLPEEFDVPATTHICGEEVIIILWSKTPQIIQIKNKEVAVAYKKYFDILWERAR